MIIACLAAVDRATHGVRLSVIVCTLRIVVCTLRIVPTVDDILLILLCRAGMYSLVSTVIECLTYPTFCSAVEFRV